jgi:hypothetical protein
VGNIVKLDVAVSGGKVSDLVRQFEQLAARNRDLENAVSKMGTAGDTAFNKMSAGAGRVKSAFREAEQAAQKHAETMQRIGQSGGSLGAWKLAMNGASEQKRFAAENEAITQRRMASTMAEINLERQQRANERASHRDRVRAAQEVKAAGLINQAQLDREIAQSKELMHLRTGASSRMKGFARERDERLSPERAAAARSFSQQRADFAEAARLTERNMTAQERHNARVERYHQLKKVGALTEKDFGRAVEASNKELEKQGSGGLLTGIKGELVGIAASYIGIQATVGFITQRIEQWREANRKLQQESEGLATEWETRRKRAQVQGGMSDAESRQAQQRVFGIANQTGVKMSVAEDMQTALETVGFSPEESSGESLSLMLKLVQAQGLKPEEIDVSSFSKSLAMFFRANKLEMNRANVKKYAQALQSMAVKKTPLKIPDFIFQAQEAAAMSVFGVGDETQFALLTHGSQINRPRVSTTEAREVVSRLATAGADTSKKAALQRMRLRPTDVDFVGEDYYTVMQRMRQGVARLRKQDQGIVLKQLFEEAGVGPARIMMDTAEEVRDIEREAFNDPDSLERDAANMRRSRESTKNVAENKVDFEKQRRGEYGDQYRKAIESRGLAKGDSADRVAQRLGWYDWHRRSGERPETALVLSGLGYSGSLGVLGGLQGAELAKTIPGGAADFAGIEAEAIDNAGGRDEMTRRQREYLDNTPEAIQKRKASEKRATYRRAADTINRRKGMSIGQRAEKIDYFDRYTSDQYGHSPESVSNAMFPGAADRGAFGEELRRLTSAMEENNRLMQEQNSKPPVNVNVTTKEPVSVDRAKPRPRNSVMLQPDRGSRP